MRSIFILGRQPAIGRAELESLFGASRLTPLNDYAIACDLPVNDVAFSRIGSSIRLAKVLTTLPTTSWSALAGYTAEALPQHLGYLPEGKLKLGLSVFGLPVGARQLLRTGLELKKVCRANNHSVRLVPNADLALNSAQVLHNNLTGELGMELLYIAHGKKTVLAQTVAVQDITAYTARDRGRPKRDAFVGMLPPKLAQTIINLSTGDLPADYKRVILDPFCGTGVVLQEALLMGYSAYGSDINQKMVDFSSENVITWLYKTYPDLSGQVSIELGDATDHQWSTIHINAVACETYLGRPLSTWPNDATLHEIIGTCNVIIQKFLKNLYTQILPGARLCIAVPAWQSPNGKFYHLPLLDHLGEIGYNRISFEYARTQELVYYRPDQIVARELVVITRK